MRLVLIAIGKKLVAEGRLEDPEDVMYLPVQRAAHPDGRKQRVQPRGDLVGDRRDQREDAYEVRPRDWVGTATEDNLAFPYLSLWAFPEKVYRKPSEVEGEIHPDSAPPRV